MQREMCGWIGIFSILGVWMGGVVYFAFKVEAKLLDSILSMERSASEILVEEGDRIRAMVADVSDKTDQVTHLVNQVKTMVPPKMVVVNKDGCIPTECLARLLLLMGDLRRAFALGAMSSDAVHAIKPMLLELHDQDITDSLLVIENFDTTKGYAVLREELNTIRDIMRTVKSTRVPHYLTRWVKVENSNDKIWQDFTRLENLVSRGAWNDAYELVKSSEIFASVNNAGAMTRMQLWVRDLEDILRIEGCLSLIYNKLIERVNVNPEGI